MNKKLIAAGAVAVSALLAVAAGASLNAIQTFAQSGVPAASTSPTVTPLPAASSGPVQIDPAKGGHVGKNGVKEELLSGDTAQKVKTAALSAVPGGTIQRVETDAEGSPYEAHMTKSDGSKVTVKVDGNFNVTGTEDGMR